MIWSICVNIINRQNISVVFHGIESYSVCLLFRWEIYKACGTKIQDTPFVAFKVPLKEVGRALFYYFSSTNFLLFRLAFMTFARLLLGASCFAIGLLKVKMLSLIYTKTNFDWSVLKRWITVLYRRTCVTIHPCVWVWYIVVFTFCHDSR